MSEEEKTTLTEENAEVVPQEEKEPSEGEKTILPRQILGFGSIPSIKSLLVDGDSSDEEEAIKKIAKKCMDDFIVKCVRLIETCAEVPSSIYTYVMFLERYAWIQQEDSTMMKGNKEVIVSSDGGEYVSSGIYNMYYADNHRLSLSKELDGMFDKDLLGTKEQAKEKIKNMFGPGFFPNIVLWYNYNEKDSIWQYAYSIKAPNQTK